MENLHNLTCIAPYTKELKVYSYDLTDSFINSCITIAVVNFLTFLPCILLNAVILAAIMNEAKLQVSSNISMFSICIADLLIGVMVQPVFGGHLVQVSKKDHICSLSSFLVYIIPILVLHCPLLSCIVINQVSIPHFGYYILTIQL